MVERDISTIVPGFYGIDRINLWAAHMGEDWVLDDGEYVLVVQQDN